MKKIVSIIMTAAIFAAVTVPVMAKDDKITSEEVKELFCSNGLQNYPELLEREAIIQNPQVGGWEKDVYKLKDLVDVSFSYKGCTMQEEYCQGRRVDLNNSLHDDEITFHALDKDGYTVSISIYSDDYGLEEYRGKVYYHNYPTEGREPYSDEAFSFFNIDGEKYGYQKIADIINEADIGKVNVIASASMVLYIRSDKGEYVIPQEPSYDLSATYLGREEISYAAGVLIPFEEYERICVYIDKNDRDDPRDIKFAVDKAQNVIYYDDSMNGDEIRDTDTLSAYIGTESVFSDVEGDLVSFVNELADLGIITGYEDGTFRPSGTLTRAEAAAMISRMLHYSGEYDGRFSDVPTDAWYAAELAALLDKGIINGTGDNTFSPEDTIKYIDMLKIIEGVLGYTLTAADDDYAELVIEQAMKIGLLDGIGSFETNSPTLRGDIAVIISTALDTHMYTSITQVSGNDLSGAGFEIGIRFEDITLIDYINGGKLNGELK